jgi:Arylsulfotransferase (ASST)
MGTVGTGMMVLVSTRTSSQVCRGIKILTFAALILMTACGSGSDGVGAASAAATTAPSVSNAAPSGPLGLNIQAPSALGPGFNIAISPAVTPGFVPGIHDYVIDCTSAPTVQLSVLAPQAIGFAYLGTTADSALVRPTTAQFQQTLSILPGQRFSFSIGQAAYSVRCLPPDFPPLTSSEAGLPQAEWYVFAPTIGATSSYVIITDSHGTPVWWMAEPGGSASDAKVLGSDQIAWTIISPPGVGGNYTVRNFSGQLLNTLYGGLDDHELQPTPDGTYLAIHEVNRVCPPDCADLSPWGGSAQSEVLDAEIIELDQNSNVLWTWRTRDHIALSEYADTGWYPSQGDDIIHMNAIEPDGPDGLMFSARHLNAIYHVTKSTGAIDWKIGGTNRPESLVVVGDMRPSATGVEVLSGQHDVRKWPDGTISVHDNGTLASRPPSVVRYRIDMSNHTAQVVQEIQDARVSSSLCCGSARLLPGGNWLVQWGDNPFMTELDPNGTPVVTIQYNMGSAFSYRAVPVAPGVVSGDALRQGMDAMAAATSPP